MGFAYVFICRASQAFFQFPDFHIFQGALPIMENHGKIMENRCHKDYGIFWQFYGEIIFK